MLLVVLSVTDQTGNDPKSCTIEGLDKFYATYYTAKQMNKLQLVTTWSNFPNIMLKKNPTILRRVEPFCIHTI